FWKAIADSDITICLHIGSGNPAPHASMETPIEAWISTMPMSIAVGAAGWVPYFLERADFSNWRHKRWTNSIFQDRKPSETFRRHFLNCFIDDAFGLQ